METAAAAKVVSDTLESNYGEYGLLNHITERKWTPVAEINEFKVGSAVLVRGKTSFFKSERKFSFLGSSSETI